MTTPDTPTESPKTERPVYKKGDIVWTKLGSSWWPGEVKNQDELPSDLNDDFKRPPLVIVKFFDEDSYEYVKNWAHIYPYNCDKKVDFIKKGMAAFRSKAAHMEKFPKDVTRAEEITGGNPNILSESVFLPPKKFNYSELFSTPSPNPKKPKSTSSTRKSINKNSVLISHRRFLGHDDYKAFICVQYPGKFSLCEDEEGQKPFREDEGQTMECKSCGFSTKRLGVMMIHAKMHLNSVHKKKLKPARKKKDMKKKDIFSDLLEEWSDEDRDETKENNLETKDSSVAEKKPPRTYSKKSKKEYLEGKSWEDSDLVDFLNKDKATSKKKDKSGETSNSPKLSSDTQQDIKNCFDFDEEEEDEDIILATTPGRKIPRVIPEKSKSPRTEELQHTLEDDTADINRDEILKTSQTFNKSCDDKSTDNLEDIFKEVMEETSMPQMEKLLNNFKSEQNFHDGRTVKKPDKCGPSETETGTLADPKNKCVRSFEDFELEINRQRGIVLEVDQFLAETSAELPKKSDKIKKLAEKVDYLSQGESTESNISQKDESVNTNDYERQENKSQVSEQDNQNESLLKVKEPSPRSTRRNRYQYTEINVDILEKNQKGSTKSNMLKKSDVLPGLMTMKDEKDKVLIKEKTETDNLVILETVQLKNLGQDKIEDLEEKELVEVKSKRITRGRQSESKVQLTAQNEDIVQKVFEESVSLSEKDSDKIVDSGIDTIKSKKTTKGQKFKSTEQISGKECKKSGEESEKILDIVIEKSAEIRSGQVDKSQMEKEIKSKRTTRAQKSEVEEQIPSKECRKNEDNDNTDHYDIKESIPPMGDLQNIVAIAMYPAIEIPSSQDSDESKGDKNQMLEKTKSKITSRGRKSEVKKQISTKECHETVQKDGKESINPPLGELENIIDKVPSSQDFGSGGEIDKNQIIEETKSKRTTRSQKSDAKQLMMTKDDKKIAESQDQMQSDIQSIQPSAGESEKIDDITIGIIEDTSNSQYIDESDQSSEFKEQILTKEGQVSTEKVFTERRVEKSIYISAEKLADISSKKDLVKTGQTDETQSIEEKKSRRTTRRQKSEEGEVQKVAEKTIKLPKVESKVRRSTRHHVRPSEKSEEETSQGAEKVEDTALFDSTEEKEEISQKLDQSDSDIEISLKVANKSLIHNESLTSRRSTSREPKSTENLNKKSSSESRRSTRHQTIDTELEKHTFRRSRSRSIGKQIGRTDEKTSKRRSRHTDFVEKELLTKKEVKRTKQSETVAETDTHNKEKINYDEGMSKTDEAHKEHDQVDDKKIKRKTRDIDIPKETYTGQASQVEEKKSKRHTRYSEKESVVEEPLVEGKAIEIQEMCQKSETKAKEKESKRHIRQAEKEEIGSVSEKNIPDQIPVILKELKVVEGQSTKHEEKAREEQEKRGRGRPRLSVASQSSVTEVQADVGVLESQDMFPLKAENSKLVKEQSPKSKEKSPKEQEKRGRGRPRLFAPLQSSLTDLQADVGVPKSQECQSDMSQNLTTEDPKVVEEQSIKCEEKETKESEKRGRGRPRLSLLSQSYVTELQDDVGVSKSQDCHSDMPQILATEDSKVVEEQSPKCEEKAKKEQDKRGRGRPRLSVLSQSSVTELQADVEVSKSQECQSDIPETLATEDSKVVEELSTKSEEKAPKEQDKRGRGRPRLSVLSQSSVAELQADVGVPKSQECHSDMRQTLATEDSKVVEEQSPKYEEKATKEQDKRGRGRPRLSVLSQSYFTEPQADVEVPKSQECHSDMPQTLATEDLKVVEEQSPKYEEKATKEQDKRSRGRPRLSVLSQSSFTESQADLEVPKSQECHSDMPQTLATEDSKVFREQSPKCEEKATKERDKKGRSRPRLSVLSQSSATEPQADVEVSKSQECQSDIPETLATEDSKVVEELSTKCEEKASKEQDKRGRGRPRLSALSQSSVTELQADVGAPIPQECHSDMSQTLATEELKVVEEQSPKCEEKSTKEQDKRGRGRRRLSVLSQSSVTELQADLEVSKSQECQSDVLETLATENSRVVEELSTKCEEKAKKEQDKRGRGRPRLPVLSQSSVTELQADVGVPKSQECHSEMPQTLATEDSKVVEEQSTKCEEKAMKEQDKRGRGRPRLSVLSQSSVTEIQADVGVPKSQECHSDMPQTLAPEDSKVVEEQTTKCEEKATKEQDKRGRGRTGLSGPSHSSVTDLQADVEAPDVSQPLQTEGKSKIRTTKSESQFIQLIPEKFIKQLSTELPKTEEGQLDESQPSQTEEIRSKRKTKKLESKVVSEKNKELTKSYSEKSPRATTYSEKVREDQIGKTDNKLTEEQPVVQDNKSTNQEVDIAIVKPLPNSTQQAEEKTSKRKTGYIEKVGVEFDMFENIISTSKGHSSKTLEKLDRKKSRDKETSRAKKDSKFDQSEIKEKPETYFENKREEKQVEEKGQSRRKTKHTELVENEQLEFEYLSPKSKDKKATWRESSTESKKKRIKKEEAKVEHCFRERRARTTYSEEEKILQKVLKESAEEAKRIEAQKAKENNAQEKKDKKETTTDSPEKDKIESGRELRRRTTKVSEEDRILEKVLRESAEEARLLAEQKAEERDMNDSQYKTGPQKEEENSAQQKGIETTSIQEHLPKKRVRKSRWDSGPSDKSSMSLEKTKEITLGVVIDTKQKSGQFNDGKDLKNTKLGESSCFTDTKPSLLKDNKDLKISVQSEKIAELKLDNESSNEPIAESLKVPQSELLVKKESLEKSSEMVVQPASLEEEKVGQKGDSSKGTVRPEISMTEKVNQNNDFSIESAYLTTEIKNKSIILPTEKESNVNVQSIVYDFPFDISEIPLPPGEPENSNKKSSEIIVSEIPPLDQIPLPESSTSCVPVKQLTKPDIKVSDTFLKESVPPKKGRWSRRNSNPKRDVTVLTSSTDKVTDIRLDKSKNDVRAHSGFDDSEIILPPKKSRRVTESNTLLDDDFGFREEDTSSSLQKNINDALNFLIEDTASPQRKSIPSNSSDTLINVDDKILDDPSTSTDVSVQDDTTKKSGDSQKGVPPKKKKLDIPLDNFEYEKKSLASQKEEIPQPLKKKIQKLYENSQVLEKSRCNEMPLMSPLAKKKSFAFQEELFQINQVQVEGSNIELSNKTEVLKNTDLVVGISSIWPETSKGNEVEGPIENQKTEVVNSHERRGKRKSKLLSKEEEMPAVVKQKDITTVNATVEELVFDYQKVDICEHNRDEVVLREAVSEHIETENKKIDYFETLIQEIFPQEARIEEIQEPQQVVFDTAIDMSLESEVVISEIPIVENIQETGIIKPPFTEETQNFITPPGTLKRPFTEETQNFIILPPDPSCSSVGKKLLAPLIKSDVKIEPTINRPDSLGKAEKAIDKEEIVIPKQSQLSVSVENVDVTGVLDAVNDSEIDSRITEQDLLSKNKKSTDKEITDNSKERLLNASSIEQANVEVADVFIPENFPKIEHKLSEEDSFNNYQKVAEKEKIVELKQRQLSESTFKQENVEVTGVLGTDPTLPDSKMEPKISEHDSLSKDQKATDKGKTVPKPSQLSASTLELANDELTGILVSEHVPKQEALSQDQKATDKDKIFKPKHRQLSGSTFEQAENDSRIKFTKEPIKIKLSASTCEQTKVEFNRVLTTDKTSISLPDSNRIEDSETIKSKETKISGIPIISKTKDTNADELNKIIISNKPISKVPTTARTEVVKDSNKGKLVIKVTEPKSSKIVIRPTVTLKPGLAKRLGEKSSPNVEEETVVMGTKPDVIPDPPIAAEMVEIEENLIQTISQKELADAQVTITPDQVISEKKPTTGLGNLLAMTDFSESSNSSIELPDKKSERGTEFSINAMTKPLESKIPRGANTYGRLELLDILEGNSNSNSSSTSSGEQFKKSSFEKPALHAAVVEGFQDFEESIPCSAIVLNKKDPQQHQSSTFDESPKLLERLSQPQKVVIQSDIKVKEAGKTLKVTPKPLPAQTQPRIVIKSKLQGTSMAKSPSRKPIILSEQIIRPATVPSASVVSTPAPQATVSALKRPFEDIEDVEKPFIITKTARIESPEVSEEETIREYVPKKKQNRGKAKILQHSIITPQGKLVKTTATQPQPMSGQPKPVLAQPKTAQLQLATKKLLGAAAQHQLAAIQSASAQPDEVMFDINSMPIVLSDELLTPESIEQMPVVLSDEIISTSSTPATQKSTTAVAKEKPVPVVKMPPKKQMAIMAGLAISKSLKLPAVSTKMGAAVPKTTVGPAFTSTPQIVVADTKPKSKIVGSAPALSKLPVAAGLLTTPGNKSAKYLLVSSNVAGQAPQQKVAGTIKQTAVGKPAPAIPSVQLAKTAQAGVVTTDPTNGSKIMIVTNQQGEAHRLLLTPAQQKMLGMQGQPVKDTKTMVKGPIPKGLLSEALPSSSGLAPLSPTATAVTQPQQKVLTPLTTTPSQITGVNQLPRTGISIPAPRGSKLTAARKYQAKSGKQKTILIKNQLGQTVKKIQGTDDEELDRQVAEQLAAIKATAMLQAQEAAAQRAQESGTQRTADPTSPKPGVKLTQKRTPPKKVELTKPKLAQPATPPSTQLAQKLLEGIASANATPALSPLGIQQTQPVAQPMLRKTVAEKPLVEPMKTAKEDKPMSSHHPPQPAAVVKPEPSTSQLSNLSSTSASNKVAGAESSKNPDRPLQQLVIQDAMGNQTTITEGQILALPSETVDGQPQSYMLITLDESGNLTPLNNEALMSLDPSLGLGGDISNMVLQVDQGQGVLATASAVANKTDVAAAPIITDQQKVAERIKGPVIEPKELNKPQLTRKPPLHAPQTSKPVLKSQITPEGVQKPLETELPQNLATASLETHPSLLPELHVSLGDPPSGDPAQGQQLIVTGDPNVTQKFLESLSDGSTDLASILTADGGSLLIQIDGQQILIRTNSQPDSAALMPSESSEGYGNPIFSPPHKPNRDILAAALANTDVFQGQDSPTSGISKEGLLPPGAELSPNSTGGTLYPMHVSNVLETSLTLSSPIMTPLEAPSIPSKKILDEADILNQIPKNVDLPITITDPNISQTVPHPASGLVELSLPPLADLSCISTAATQILSSHSSSLMPRGAEAVKFSSTLTEITDSPYISTGSQILSSATREEGSKEAVKSTEVSECAQQSKAYNGNMPLLTDDLGEEAATKKEEVGNLVVKEGNKEDLAIRETTTSTTDSMLDAGLCTLGGAMCSSLSEPPPDMFELPEKEEEISSDQSNSVPEAETLSLNSDGSGEIPLQPQIVAKLSDIKRLGEDSSGDSSDIYGAKRAKFD